MLHGRRRERDAIDALLDGARRGSGGGLTLHGEPGIGKTALLGYAAERAADMRVLRTAGVEPEADIGYAAVQRLLQPVLDRTDRLPEPQARALDVVFGRSDGAAPERFLVSLAILSLLSEAATERPVVCLVDDAHWADAPSLDALTFVARRLEAEPVAMLFAARADEGRRLDPAGLAGLRIAGLDDAAARELLAECVGERLSAGERDLLLRTTAGNPLALRELAGSRPRPGAGDEPVPLTAELRRSFLTRVDRHGPGVRSLLLLVATDGTGRCDVIRRAAALGGIDAGPLESGELDDLVAVDGTGVAFRHPLIRSAVYHAARGADRRAAHRALADALGDDTAADRRAWHLGQATDGPDESVATALERSADRATRRAGAAAAAAALERAADLSEADTSRARRLVAAAAAWEHVGEIERATVLLDRIGALGDDAASAVRVDVTTLRALMEVRAGTPAEAVTLLGGVLPEGAGRGRHDRIRLGLLLGEAGFMADEPAAMSHVGSTARELPVAEGDADSALVVLMRAVADAASGAAPELPATALAGLDELDDPFLLVKASGMARALGRDDLMRPLQQRAVHLARTRGAAGSLAWVLLSVVADELRDGRFSLAEAYGEEGRRLAVESGQPNTAARHASLLALVAAHRGATGTVRQLADEALTAATERQLPDVAGWARHALGLAELLSGHATAALRQLEAMARSTRAGTGPVLDAALDVVEAAVRAGEPDRAAGPLERFDTWANATGAPELRALSARARALLASGEDATAAYEVALELHAERGRPMDEARTRLLAGEHLRRERRPSQAREHLRAAFETFTRLDAPGWASRAQEELRACGETVRSRPSALSALTPQELRIATAAGEGATNREIAAQLFLSPRTVEYHLRKVFQKTGVSSRTELARLVLTLAG
ncbi:MAG TPA: AAA family ATPase [Streptosporangiales bacterium]